MNFYNSNRNTNGELNVIYQVKNTFKNNKDPLILFDVGANIGEYSKQLIEIFRETRMTIYAFEPAKKTYQKLHDNLKNYNNICLLNIGLSHKEQQGILYSEPTGQSPLASLYQRELKHINLEMNVSEEIKLNTIDNFCESHEINEIHFLKLDVEGHEFKVLEGAKNMLNKGKIKMIQFEFGACNIDSRTYFKDFFKLFCTNYNIYRIVKDGLFHIEEYHEEEVEIFTYSNYFCILKELLSNQIPNSFSD